MNETWRLWILGSGVALPSAARSNVSMALEVAGKCWLIDCGGSPYQRLLQAGLNPRRIQGVILSHSHADHMGGLPVLLFHLSMAGYEGALPIYGLPETLALVRRVVEAFELEEYCVAHRWEELSPARAQVELEPGITLTIRPVCHSRPAMGIRLDLPDGRALSYSGDTGPCPATVALARGVSWLVHECTTRAPLPGHSTPEQVAETALQSGAERLGIVHYDPRYILPADELIERIRRAGYQGEIRILEDMDALG